MDEHPKKTIITHTILVLEEEFTDQNGRPLPLNRPSPLFDPPERKREKSKEEKQGRDKKKKKGKNRSYDSKESEEDGRPSSKEKKKKKRGKRSDSTESEELDEDGNLYPKENKNRNKKGENRSDNSMEVGELDEDGCPCPCPCLEEKKKKIRRERSVDSKEAVERDVGGYPTFKSYREVEENLDGYALSGSSPNVQKQASQHWPPGTYKNYYSPPSAASAPWGSGPVGSMMGSFNKFEQSAYKKTINIAQQRVAFKDEQSALYNCETCKRDE